MIPIALAFTSNIIISGFDVTDSEVVMPALTMTLSDYPDSTAFVDVSPTDDSVPDSIAELFNRHMVDIISKIL